jgi:tRNA nucleotidyltransferase (CCA-adding enzyme)
MEINPRIPKEIEEIAKTLAEAGFEAHLVGGCVRDLLLGKDPADWDVATNATPEEVQRLFADCVYENTFGTVGVKTDSDEETLKVVEVTTYRTESVYSDYRRPDAIKFADTIEEDLSRRDFTVNALALTLNTNPQIDTNATNLIDLFKGQEDLKHKVIRAVGDANERFREDALRMMRAVRFACQLDFAIEEKTQNAIHEHADLLAHISTERIQAEFNKIIMTPLAGWGMELLRETGLMKHIMPEALESVGVEQNLHHIYTVWEHSKRALEYAAQKNYSLEVRLASFLHDIGKPRTKQGSGERSTFYQHEHVGARMVKKMLERLKYPRHIIDDVTHLVRHHMFYYNVGEISDAGVRRFISRVGVDYIDDLIKVREADRIGSGVPKAVPYKLRHMLFMIDKVRKDPISPKMLKLNGSDLMSELGMQPSPRMGWILNTLLEDVLDDPARNDREWLVKRAKELNELSDAELQKLNAQAKEAKAEAEEEAEGEIKKKHRVS